MTWIRRLRKWRPILKAPARSPYYALQLWLVLQSFLVAIPISFGLLIVALPAFAILILVILVLRITWPMMLFYSDRATALHEVLAKLLEGGFRQPGDALSDLSTLLEQPMFR
jgi:hypothetical protein